MSHFLNPFGFTQGAEHEATPPRGDLKLILWCQTSPDKEYNVKQCLVDLKAPDPRIEKERIELSKDKLLKDSYAWILNNQAFKDWQENHHTRLLWIKGDPGKGKTMM